MVYGLASHLFRCHNLWTYLLSEMLRSFIFRQIHDFRDTKRRFGSYLFVDIFPVSDLSDLYNFDRFLDKVNNPVITYSDTP
jgi:hypothetical protein